MKVATREIVRSIDSITINRYGIPGMVLMENAGKVTADIIVQEFPESKNISIFAGIGNNGGDGFVIARHLMNRGLDVNTCLLTNPIKLKGDSLTNYKILKKTGGNITELKNTLRNIPQADLIVDAIFGTGLDREVQGFYKKVINYINSNDIPVISVDLPSGLDANTGSSLGSTIKANITATYVLPKLGMCIHPGIDYCGKVYVVDITTPKNLENDIPYHFSDFNLVGKLIHKRNSDTHKGTYGHLFVLAGSTGKSGAAYLASLGALRSGVGLVTIGVPESINPTMEIKTTESMTEPIPETSNHTFGKESVKPAMGIIRNKKTALAVGPGISTTKETREFLYKILENSNLPTVVDADGITLLANNLSLLKKLKTPIVLTPHPGEMARLIGKDIGFVQANRIEVATQFSKKYNTYLVLKGSRSLVSTPDGKLYINPTGNPSMATGGTGDVLTGVIGGFLAQGYKPDDAAILGVFIHGLAGDILTEEIGSPGILASELANKIPKTLQNFSKFEINYFNKLN